MPKIRKRAYKGGDRVTIQIPDNPDPKLLKLLNTPKYVSPYIIDILTEVAHSKYPNLKSANMDNIDKVSFVKE
jgi:hypothetical protein